MNAPIPNYALAAYMTRRCLRMKKPKDECYRSALSWLMNHFGLSKVQANKFILSYLADQYVSRLIR